MSGPTSPVPKYLVVLVIGFPIPKDPTVCIAQLLPDAFPTRGRTEYQTQTVHNIDIPPLS